MDSQTCHLSCLPKACAIPLPETVVLNGVGEVSQVLFSTMLERKRRRAPREGEKLEDVLHRLTRSPLNSLVFFSNGTVALSASDKLLHLSNKGSRQVVALQSLPQNLKMKSLYSCTLTYSAIHNKSPAMYNPASAKNRNKTDEEDEMEQVDKSTWLSNLKMETRVQTVHWEKVDKEVDLPGNVLFRRMEPAVRLTAKRLMENLKSSSKAVAEMLMDVKGRSVTQLCCEFLLDEKDNFWLSWIPSCQFGSTLMGVQEMSTSSSTMELSGLLGEASSTRIRRKGRRRMEKEEKRSPRPTSPTEALAMGVQFDHAANTVEEIDVVDNKRNRFVVSNPTVQDEGLMSVDFGSTAFSPGEEKSTFLQSVSSPQQKIKVKRDSIGSLPSRKSCHGDFCDFSIQEPDMLLRTAKEEVSSQGTSSSTASAANSAMSIARKLLSSEEFQFIQRNAAAFRDKNSLSTCSIDPDEMFQLPMKSIAIARKEKRGYMKRLAGTDEVFKDNKQNQKRYQMKKKRDMGPDALEVMTEEHGGVTLGMYYQQVPLCATCFRVYTTLDKARDMIQREQHSRKEESNRTKRDPTTEATRDDLIQRLCLKKRTRPRSREQQQDELKTEVRTPSPVRSARKYMQEIPSILPNLSTPDLPTFDRKRVEDEKAAEKSKVMASAIVKASDGAFCTREQTKELKSKHKALPNFDDLDGYLRGTRKKKFTDFNKREEEERAQERERQHALNTTKLGQMDKKHLNSKKKKAQQNHGGYKGHVLLVEEDPDLRQAVVDMLTEEEYILTDFADAPPALELSEDNHFDLLLVSTDLESMSGVEMTKIIRKREKTLDASIRRLPIVAFTYNTSPSDLRCYMEVGMDGCVSKPVDKMSLLKTVAAAIPHHRPAKAATAANNGNQEESTRNKSSADNNVSATVNNMRPATTGLMTSTDVVKLTLPMASRSTADEPIAVGVFQFDADTSFPYLVMGSKVQDSRMFNLVFINDFFETYESLQIFFRPIVQKYPGLQILLFNLPGQAFTEWRKDVVLNNEYYAECLEALLRHVDYNGTKEFETRGPYASPYYLGGFGNGANIASYFALRYKPPNMRAVLSLNGYSHVDPHLAGVLHDCMNVFNCCPATRPDLPVYFYSRFLFSSSYLTKVTAPLALNLLTAVHNPIQLQGRMQICQGSLAHRDIRPMLNDNNCPMIMVHSSQDGLIKPLHVESFVKVRGGEVRSIRQCLKERTRPCVVWLRAGHELFQESRRPLSDLIEQLVTGYHEKHDVNFLPTSDGMMEAGKNGRRKRGKRLGTREPGQDGKFFEDKFIDNVLGTLHDARAQDLVEKNPFLAHHTVSSTIGAAASAFTELSSPKQQQEDLDMLSASYDPGKNPSAEKARWDQFREETFEKTQRKVSEQVDKNSKKTAHVNSRFGKLKVATKNDEPLVAMTLDPTKRNFDWEQRRRRRRSEEGEDDDLVWSPTGQRDKKKPVMRPVEVPEVAEYMQWRIARNKKRLGKLVEAATVIQRGWRSFLARTLVQKLRRTRAALFIQTRWRQKLARDKLKERKQEEWAARLVQRCWRGKVGREAFKDKKAQAHAATAMQRIFRGRKGKKRVDHIKARRRNAALKIQNMVRARIARSMAWKMREKRNSAIDIQRVFRGHKGRVRAKLERDKYLFSKAQSQGIAFGRQMLLEHKLHGTRLQSEVSMLSKEKAETEEKVDSLLGEISEFDRSIKQLEKEMVELTAVETEAKGILDENAKLELREAKFRLDKEFGVLLSKIADRKDRLKTLEAKLQTIDRTRQSKEEELRDLERKLVVLLEEQQQELEQIKKRQAARGELMLPEKAATLIRGRGQNGEHLTDEGGVGGGYRGPTPQQQEQANMLMQSTESLMKFGFMSMSLTYFSSLNMIKAMRKVGALNTVLNGSGPEQLQKLLQGQVGGIADGASVTGGAPPELLADAMEFKPAFKRGEMPEQQDIRVAAWTVEDVGDWLETLKLKQYRHAFADAAIDGSFLYDLNDDDLRNSLGIEHNLHRKKILSSIERLRRLEGAREAESLANSSLSQASLASIANAKGTQGLLANSISGGGTLLQNGSSPTNVTASSSSAGQGSAPLGGVSELMDHDKLVTMVRHGKLKELKPALAHLPDAKFDVADEVGRIEGFGTQYRDELNRLQWHINYADEHGNSLLTVAAQNGRQKIAQFLVQKGANPNHSNNQLQTVLHYALAYNFYDFASWLADADGGGADDTLENAFGLSPYDGLQ